MLKCVFSLRSAVKHNGFGSCLWRNSENLQQQRSRLCLGLEVRASSHYCGARHDAGGDLGRTWSSYLMSGEVVVIGSKDKDDNDPPAQELEKAKAQNLHPFFNIPVDAAPVKRAVLTISSRVLTPKAEAKAGTRDQEPAAGERRRGQRRRRRCGVQWSGWRRQCGACCAVCTRPSATRAWAGGIARSQLRVFCDRHLVLGILRGPGTRERRRWVQRSAPRGAGAPAVPAFWRRRPFGRRPAAGRWGASTPATVLALQAMACQ